MLTLPSSPPQAQGEASQLSAFWEQGSPDLPACGLRRGSSHGQVRPFFINSSSIPSRGTKPRGADDRKASSGVASSGWLARRQRDQGRGTSRGAHDASHDDRGEAGARRAPACAVSLFPLWCKGSKHRPRHQTKATIPVQQDQDQRDDRKEVTVEPRTASSSESLTGEDRL